MVTRLCNWNMAGHSPSVVKLKFSNKQDNDQHSVPNDMMALRTLRCTAMRVWRHRELMNGACTHAHHWREPDATQSATCTQGRDVDDLTLIDNRSAPHGMLTREWAIAWHTMKVPDYEGYQLRLVYPCCVLREAGERTLGDAILNQMILIDW